MVEIDHAAHQYESITDEIQAKSPFHQEGYEPKFVREGIERRTLSFVTDDVDSLAGGVPRNNPAAVGRVLVPDTATPNVTEQAQVDKAFDDLLKMGFLEQRDDGTYGLTEAGYTELYN